MRNSRVASARTEDGAAGDSPYEIAFGHIARSPIRRCSDEVGKDHRDGTPGRLPGPGLRYGVGAPRVQTAQRLRDSRYTAGRSSGPECLSTGSS
jgi:hypothetical protein